MNIELVKYDSLEGLYESARVCRNSDNATRALEHSIKSGHESILEQASVTFKIMNISRSCSHQLVRHRLASYAQQSQRHTKLTGHDWYVRPISFQDLGWYDACMQTYMNMYNEAIANGVKLEDARYLLPNACHTELVMTINLRSLINFFEHRICSRAQMEIRELALLMYHKIRHLYPIVFKYYKFPACKNCKEPCSKEERDGCIY